MTTKISPLVWIVRDDDGCDYLANISWGRHYFLILHSLLQSMLWLSYSSNSAKVITMYFDHLRSYPPIAWKAKQTYKYALY